MRDTPHNFFSLMVLFVVLALPSGCDLVVDEQTRIEKAKERAAEGEYRIAMIELKKVLQGNPNNREARLLLGELSLSVGQAPAAEKELRRAQQLGAPAAEVLVLLGRALLAQQSYQQLLDEIHTDATEAVEAQAEILLLRGDAHLGTGEPDEARRAFRAALELQEDSAHALIGLARTEVAKADLEAADAYITQAVSTDPDDVTAWLANGGLALIRARYTDAEEAYSRAIATAKPRPTAAQAFPATAGLAEAQWRQGKSEEALNHIDQLLMAGPEHPRPKYLRALVAYDSGDYATAVEYLQQVLRVVPDYRPARLLLGASNYAQGNLEQADMYLRSVLAADPSSLPARKLLAAMRLQQRKPQDAVAILTPGLKQSPGDSQLLAMLGKATVQAGDRDTGISYLQQSAKTSPGNQALQVELAKGYLSAGDVEQAIEVLRGLPETESGPYRRELLLILAYLQKRDTGSALAEARKLLERRPNDAGMHNLMGVVQMAAGQRQDARKHLDMALELRPNYTQVLMNLARLDYLEGRMGDAQVRVEKVLEISPKDVNAMMALSQLSAMRGDQAQALEWLKRASAADRHAIAPRLGLVRLYLAQRDFERAHAIATEAAQIDPNRADVLNALGAAQMAAGTYREALNSFHKAVKAAPRSANSYYNLARAQLALRNLAEAKKTLGKALELQPTHVLSVFALAGIERREGDVKLALAHARKLQRSQRDSAIGYALEGDLHMMQGRFAKAVKAYGAASKRSESSVLAIMSFRARQKAKDPEPTRPLVRWLKKHPNDLRVRFVLAQAYQQDNRHKAAIEQYERIVQGQPKNAVALNNLAWLYHLRKDPRAIKTAELAHRLQPENGAVTDTLGWLLVQQGELERGLPLLRQAAQQAPQVPEIRYHLATALARSGAREEARKTLTELLDSGTAFEDMAEAQKMLQTLQ